MIREILLGLTLLTSSWPVLADSSRSCSDFLFRVPAVEVRARAYALDLKAQLEGKRHLRQPFTEVFDSVFEDLAAIAPFIHAIRYPKYTRALTRRDLQELAQFKIHFAEVFNKLCLDLAAVDPDPDQLTSQSHPWLVRIVNLFDTYEQKVLGSSWSTRSHQNQILQHTLSVEVGGANFVVSMQPVHERDWAYVEYHQVTQHADEVLNDTYEWLTKLF